MLAGQGVETGKSGDQVAAICPFCRHHRVSFYLAPDTGLWVCKACGKKGNGPKLLSLLLGVSFRQAAEMLEEHSIPWTEPVEKRPAKEVALPDDFELLTAPQLVCREPLDVLGWSQEVCTCQLKEKSGARGWGANTIVSRHESTCKIHRYDVWWSDDKGTIVAHSARRFWRYARRRRLSPSVIQEYGIGFCRSGPYSGRLVIPFLWQGEMVSYFARDITGAQARKVLTPRGGRQAEYLFNLDRLDRPDVIVVEGVFDCLPLADYAVASSGKQLNDTQIALLLKQGVKTIYLCWDEDARLDASEAAARLAPLIDVRLVLLPSDDPNALGRERVLEAVAAAERTTPMRRTRLRVG